MKDLPNNLTARVSAQHRDAYELLIQAGAVRARVDGKLRHRQHFPVVGDWVTYARTGADEAVIRDILPRSTLLVRKAAGPSASVQPIAANLDWVFIMNGLDGDFNLRRIERYLTIVWESGALPVILLNKADLCEDTEAKSEAVRAICWGTPVHVLSLHDGLGVDVLEHYLQPGKSVAVIGSSGTGKSTLLNALCGIPAQPTQAVRSRDSRGKHTTTRRELFELPSGALMIDTPGMRELQPWDAAQSIATVFEDIETLAATCKFGDCLHETEPGCAVLGAIGFSLEPERLSSYRKLQREAHFLARKTDQTASASERARWKAIHKEMRQFTKWRGR